MFALRYSCLGKWLLSAFYFFSLTENKYICTESHYTWIHTLWIMVLAPVLKVTSVNKAWYDSYASFLTHLWHIYCLQHNRLCTKLKSMSSMLHFTARCGLLHFLCTLSHPDFRWPRSFLIIDTIRHKERYVFLQLTVVHFW